MNEQLPARLEATALMRQVESTGGFATIIRRGDAERGTLLLLITERGEARALLGRQMTSNLRYCWSIIATPDRVNPEKFRESTNKHARFDPDCWIIELDVADAERFIAETIVSP